MLPLRSLVKTWHMKSYTPPKTQDSLFITHAHLSRVFFIACILDNGSQENLVYLSHVQCAHLSHDFFDACILVNGSQENLVYLSNVHVSSMISPLLVSSTMAHKRI
jgi:hypothetical protein